MFDYKAPSYERIYYGSRIAQSQLQKASLWNIYFQASFLVTSDVYRAVKPGNWRGWGLHQPQAIVESHLDRLNGVDPPRSTINVFLGLVLQQCRNGLHVAAYCCLPTRILQGLCAFTSFPISLLAFFHCEYHHKLQEPCVD